MYGMMPSAKMVMRRSDAAAEQVEHAENAAGVAPENVLDLVHVHAGNRNMSADPVHRQQSQREQQPLAQVRNPKYVGYGIKKLHGDLPRPPTRRRR